MRIRSFLLVFALLAAATPALAGPPWISIELPANPFDRATRGAFFSVRTYHHGDPMAFQVRAVMEGIVNGERVSRPVTMERTGTLGQWAVKTAPPEDGTWVLVVIGGEGSASATALVDVTQGRVRGVDVPFDMRDGWAIPRAVSAEEIDARLEQLAAGEFDGPLLAKPGHGAGGFPLHLLVLGAAVGLVPVGVIVARRRRK